MAKKLSPEEWGQLFFKELIKTFRWSTFDKRTVEETVIEHMLKQNLITLINVILEPTLNDMEKMMVLGLSNIHDLGERGYIKPGEKIKFDIPRTVKSGNNKGSHERTERLRFLRILNKLDLPKNSYKVVREKLLQLYDLQHKDNRLGKYFNALERLGYVDRALWEIKNGNVVFVSVLSESEPYLKKYTKEFWSVKEIYKNMQPKVKKYLKQYRASI